MDIDFEGWMMGEMSEVDIARDMIKSKLCLAVQENYTAFIQGMRRIKELDLDLSRAGIHVNNGRRKLKDAKDDLKQKLEIVQCKRNRDRLTCIQTLVSQCQVMLQQEQQMVAAAKQGEFCQVCCKFITIFNIIYFDIESFLNALFYILIFRR